MGGHQVAPVPALVYRYPDVYLSTGLVAENHARESTITREEQDRFALVSHQRALAAIDGGRFVDEIVPIRTAVVDLLNGGSGSPAVRESTFQIDERPRR